MKLYTLFLASCLFLAAAPAMAQADAKVATAPKPEKQAIITFAEVEKEFDDIKAGQKLNHKFAFTNTGTAPLIINKVLTTCGCTVPNYPKEPIAPNGKGVIEITFDSKGKVGRQNKVITVLSNAENNDEHLTIRTNVLPK